MPIVQTTIRVCVMRSNEAVEKVCSWAHRAEIKLEAQVEGPLLAVCGFSPVRRKLNSCLLENMIIGQTGLSVPLLFP